MKAKYIGILSLALLSIFGCDDNTGTLGMGMLPDSDGLSAHTASFDVTTYSVEAEQVFSKTSTGYIGRFTDPDFGYYESSFLSELNCTDDYIFPAVYKESADGTSGTGMMAGDTVVSVSLVLYYKSWFGDSLNACRMSVYELNDEWLNDRKTADNYRYTDFDITKYYDPNKLLGRKAYSAYDATIPDSVRNATDSYGNSIYYPYVAFRLDKEQYGNRILKLNREYQEGKNDYFKNAENFINKVFKGIYAKSDYGDGTILYIDRVDLQMQFRFHYVDEETGLALKKKSDDENGKAGEDSLYYSTATVFASTKEVVQANKFTNSDKLKERLKETDWTYIKSPAGIFTEAVLPYDEIYKELANDTLNAVKLTFTNYHQNDNYEFSMSAPDNVLLIRKSDYKKFFTENQLPDNITSYTVAHNNIATNQYTFSNIARLVTSCIGIKNTAKAEAQKEAGSNWNEAEWEAKWTAENPDWDKVWLIPVSASYDTNKTTLIGIQNDLKPSYAKLKGGTTGDKLKLEVTYTTFNK